MQLPSYFYVISSLLIAAILTLIGIGNQQAHAISGHNEESARKQTATALVYADTLQPEYDHIIRRLDSFYRIQVNAGFNGSVLIGQGGEIFYERYFGVGNRNTGTRLMQNSSCQLASITKTFTAAAILYLAQHKYLDIDDPVQNYLPGFPYAGITIRMLMNHRSGIPDYLKWAPRFTKNNGPMYNEELLTLFTKHKPALEFRSNTRFKYSNSNYALLGSIIETVTEMNYSEFMRRYVFEPLGMKHTFVYDPAATTPLYTTISYKSNWVREPDTYADGIYGDKGIYSTVRDMYRWDQSFYQQTLLSNETIELAYGPCSFEKPGIKNYGLGWRMLCYPSGNKIIYHNGWWHGNNTVFYRFVQENMTFIILGNKYNSRIYQHPKVLYSIIKNIPVSEGFDETE